MKAFILTLASLYLAYGVLMVILHPRLVYPFFPDDQVLPGFQRIELSARDGTPLFAQELPGQGPVVLYFMGNAGAVPLFGVAFRTHRQAGRHVIALEYRGGAGRPGRPSETVLKEDALVAADYALGLGRPVVVQGYSLGTGLATYVAAERPVQAVILTAPYDQLCRLMAARSWLPACVMPFVQKWRSLEQAERIDVPITVLHGSEDELIPPSYSAAFAKLPTAERQIVEGAGHADIGDFPAHTEAVNAVFEALAD